MALTNKENVSSADVVNKAMESESEWDTPTEKSTHTWSSETVPSQQGLKLRFRLSNGAEPGRDGDHNGSDGIDSDGSGNEGDGGHNIRTFISDRPDSNRPKYGDPNKDRPNCDNLSRDSLNKDDPNDDSHFCGTGNDLRSYGNDIRNFDHSKSKNSKYNTGDNLPRLIGPNFDSIDCVNYFEKACSDIRTCDNPDNDEAMEESNHLDDRSIDTGGTARNSDGICDNDIGDMGMESRDSPENDGYRHRNFENGSHGTGSKDADNGGSPYYANTSQSGSSNNSTLTEIKDSDIERNSSDGHDTGSNDTGSNDTGSNDTGSNDISSSNNSSNHKNRNIVGSSSNGLNIPKNGISNNDNAHPECSSSNGSSGGANLVVNGNQGGRVKRPMNSYMLWSVPRRRELTSEFSEMTPVEISKRLGAEWRGMPEERKRFFHEQARELKEKYMEEFPNAKYERRAKRPRKSKGVAENAPSVPELPQRVPGSLVDQQPQRSPDVVQMGDPASMAANDPRPDCDSAVSSSSSHEGVGSNQTAPRTESPGDKHEANAPPSRVDPVWRSWVEDAERMCREKRLRQKDPNVSTNGDASRAQSDRERNLAQVASRYAGATESSRATATISRSEGAGDPGQLVPRERGTHSPASTSTRSDHGGRVPNQASPGCSNWNTPASTPFSSGGGPLPPDLADIDQYFLSPSTALSDQSFLAYAAQCRSTPPTARSERRRSPDQVDPLNLSLPSHGFHRDPSDQDASDAASQGSRSNSRGKSDRGGSRESVDQVTTGHYSRVTTAALGCQGGTRAQLDLGYPDLQSRASSVGSRSDSSGIANFLNAVETSQYLLPASRPLTSQVTSGYSSPHIFPLSKQDTPLYRKEYGLASNGTTHGFPRDPVGTRPLSYGAGPAVSAPPWYNLPQFRQADRAEQLPLQSGRYPNVVNLHPTTSRQSVLEIPALPLALAPVFDQQRSLAAARSIYDHRGPALSYVYRENLDFYHSL